MEHYWKELVEQVRIIGQVDVGLEELNLDFVRVHALAIVQLCDHIMYVDNCPPSGEQLSIPSVTA